MNIKVLGIDLAKNVFQLDGRNNQGKQILNKRLSRNKLKEFMVNLPPCIVAMEACSGAHHWARQFEKYGHTPKLMAPQFVKPYIKANKNDRNDAAGIAEAVTRPDMKFVGIKTVEQQDILMLHRSRELFIKHRTALSNHMRGLLAERGVTINKGHKAIRSLPTLLDTEIEELTAFAKAHFLELYEQFKIQDTQVKQYDKKIEHIAKENTLCQELRKIPGVGPITATAAVATIGDVTVFKSGRELSAWLGLVPRQHSSGNKIRLSGITKRGDRYLRKLLIHGGRAAVRVCDKKIDGRHLWLSRINQRAGFNKAAVALANKNARTIWAILSTGECYRHSAPELTQQVAA